VVVIDKWGRTDYDKSSAAGPERSSLSDIAVELGSPPKTAHSGVHDHGYPGNVRSNRRSPTNISTACKKAAPPARSLGLDAPVE
jgi:hypothetical protein